MTDFSKLLEIKKQNANQKVADDKHQQILDGQLLITNNIVDATMALIKYLEGHTSLVKVQNQIEKVGTPDVFNVVTSLQALHNTIKTHKNTDLTEITSVMKKMLQEVEKIPKAKVEIPEQKLIDYKPQLDALLTAIQAVKTVVKNQKLIAEAPTVNVDAPNLEPIRVAMTQVVEAVNGIKIPEQKSSFTKGGKPHSVEQTSDGSVPVAQTNVLVSEKFDRYVLVYDDFDEPSEHPSKIKYYLKNKKVAEVTYKFDKHGRIRSGARSESKN